MVRCPVVTRRGKPCVRGRARRTHASRRRSLSIWAIEGPGAGRAPGSSSLSGALLRNHFTGRPACSRVLVGERRLRRFDREVVV
jgi:hypothetical protein